MAKEVKRLAKEKRDKDKIKKREKKVTKKKSESESSESDMELEIPYTDEPPEDEDKIETDTCYICSKKTGNMKDWVGCDVGPRFAHKSCTNDEVLVSLSDEEDITAYPFLCQYCDFS